MGCCYRSNCFLGEILIDQRDIAVMSTKLSIDEKLNKEWWHSNSNPGSNI